MLNCEDGEARQSDEDRFAVQLRQWRRVRGLTQERLADVSGLSVRGIRDMERGRVRAPQRRTASMLADALRLAGEEREDFLALAQASRGHRRTAPDEAVPPPQSVPGTGPPPVVPGELPPAINDLTGRDAELGTLSLLASSATAGRGTGPVVVVFHGPAGIGKTSLAVSAGHQVRPGFPDGQLFVDLLGSTGRPLDPMVALGRFLRSLNTPDDQIPATLPERMAFYRTLTHDRRLVVVLDNAVHERQVRPLLPAGAGCFVMVTCRRPLTGLEAVERLALTVLAHPAGSGLLRIIVGPRAEAEADATAELVGLCGHLPLALRIAGNRLASRPSWSVAQVVSQLRNQRMRLSALTAGDQGVRAAFVLSYGQLTPSTAMVFRRCALLAHAEFGVALAAVLVDLVEVATVAALEELVDAGLLLTVGERYRFHDLVRLFAEERLEADEPARAVAAARERMVSWLLDRTIMAGATFESAEERASEGRHAQAWLDQESIHWWHALQLAAQHGRHADVVRVIRALHWYSDVTAHRHPWDEVFRLGVASARAVGDERGEAVLLNFLGWALYYCREQYTEAMSAVEQAQSLALRIGDQREEAWALVYRVAVLLRTGCVAAAIEPARRATVLFEQIGYRVGVATARNVLATAYTELENFSQALEIHRQALAFYRSDSGLSAPGRLVAQAITLINIGRDLGGLGDWAAAVRAQTEATNLFVRVGDEFGEGRASYHLALAHEELGEQAAAAVELRRALDRFVKVNSTFWAERARQALARLPRGNRQV